MLAGTGITDAGLPALTALRADACVDARGTRVTAAGILALKDRLPSMRRTDD